VICLRKTSEGHYSKNTSLLIAATMASYQPRHKDLTILNGRVSTVVIEGSQDSRE
jgi:hypothetical protein